MKRIQRKGVFKIIAERVLSLDLNFHNEESTYSSHALHAFSAKFPPQLPRIFIENFTNQGDVVLDPMNGSGTTTLEAYLMARKGIGYDIDPLAVKIAKVKTTPLNVDENGLINDVMARVNRYYRERDGLEDVLNRRFDRKTKEFIDYWFLPEVQLELMALILAIEEFEKGTSVREFLEVVFSSIIVTKSGGVSRARDLAHSRPHLDRNKRPRNAFEFFEQRLKRFATVVSKLPNHLPQPVIKWGNAKKLEMEDSSVDLIVTSPPYANAIDYMRAHKFSLVWLGYSISELSSFRRYYIGSEAVGNIEMKSFPQFTEEVLTKLYALDRKKEAVLRKYFMEMREALAEMYRVLKPGHFAALVVGTSVMRGLDVKTPYCLADIAENDTGFDVVGIKPRSLDRNRRMLPFSKKDSNRRTQIEQRMAVEEVILLRKPKY